MIQDANKSVKEQEEILLEYLTEQEYQRYMDYQKDPKFNTDGEIEFELADLMSKARRREHDANNPNSPLCQWALEMLSKPMQYWLEKAKDLGHVQATYDHLIQIESPSRWDEIRAGYEALIEKHNHIESIERLAFLYSDEGAMNKPQVVPEVDYRKANEVLMKGIELGASWLVKKIEYNFTRMIRVGQSTEVEKAQFIDSIQNKLDHNKIELTKQQLKAIKPVLKKAKQKQVDLTNIESIINSIRFGYTRLMYPGAKKSKQELEQEEVANFLERHKYNIIKKIQK